jgi:phage gpG-like protein
MKNEGDFLNDIEKITRLLKATGTRLPQEIGAISVQFFKNRFRQGGWISNRFEAWKPRKGQRARVWGKKQKGRAILIKTGRLRRSPRVVRITPTAVVIGTDVPYAKAHNEGFSGEVTVKAHERRTFRRVKRPMISARTGNAYTQVSKEWTGNTHQVKSYRRKMNLDKRQFMGHSPFLDRRIGRYLQDSFNRLK